MEMPNKESIVALEGVARHLGSVAAEYTLSAIGAIVLLIVGWMVAGFAERSIYKAAGKVEHFDETLRRFISKLARYAILAMVLVAVLGQFGVQTASIIAALGAAGLAIGLALQGTLQNVAAGIMLLVLRPFKVGEYIEAGSIKGTVESVGLFATELKLPDGIFMMAPNSQLWSTAVTNYSRNSRRRFDLAIGIGYNDDVNKAMDIYRDIIANERRVLSDPEPYIFVSNLGESAVEVTARVWMNTSDWWNTTRDMTKLAKERFDAAGISIPFPQRDINMRQLKQG